MASIQNDPRLWNKFQRLIADGRLDSGDIRTLKLETGVSDIVFASMINDGLKQVAENTNRYVDAEDFDGVLSVKDDAGNELWNYDSETGEGAPRVRDYRNLLGYDNDNEGDARIDSFIEDTVKLFSDGKDFAFDDDGGNPIDYEVFGDTFPNFDSDWIRRPFEDALREYLTSDPGGRAISEGIRRNETVGEFSWKTDPGGNLSFNYYDDAQLPQEVEKEKEPDYDPQAIEYDFLKDVEPWKLEYQATENMGKLNPQGIDTSKMWTEMTPEERAATGMNIEEYRAAVRGETYSEEQDRIAGEITDVTDNINLVKNERATLFDSVKEILDMFQPKTYEVEDYGIKRDIMSRQQTLDERAKFDPDPLSYQGPVQVLPEYVQPEYTYEAPERVEYEAMPLEPLDPGPEYDPDYGKPEEPEFVVNEPDLGDEEGTPIETPEPEPVVAPEPDPITEPEPEPTPEPEAWKPSWDESLFTGGKNQYSTSGRQTFSGINKDGSREGYTYEYSANKGGDFSYTIKDQQGNLVEWDDLDDIAKFNITPQYIRRQQREGSN